MNKHNVVSVATVGVLMLVLLMEAAPAVQAGTLDPSPAGRVYDVTVRPFGGDPFMDCVRFGEDDTISVDTLGEGLWSYLGDGEFSAKVKSRDFPAFQVMFLGMTGEDGTLIRARAVDNFGGRYRITGFENPACTVSAGPAWRK